MDKNMLMGVVLAILVVLLLLMLVGWRGRRRRQSNLGQPKAVPSEIGTVTFAAPGHYVATTLEGTPLERVTVKGLAFRGRAEVTVTDKGLALQIPGEQAVWLPASDILGVGRATWTIDRVVERDGLVVASWQLHTEDSVQIVDSYFRFDNPATASAVIEAIETLIDVQPGAAVGSAPQKGTTL